MCIIIILKWGKCLQCSNCKFFCPGIVQRTERAWERKREKERKRERKRERDRDTERDVVCVRMKERKRKIGLFHKLGWRRDIYRMFFFSVGKRGMDSCLLWRSGNSWTNLLKSQLFWNWNLRWLKKLICNSITVFPYLFFILKQLIL
jgi:hypothetical protein